MLDKNDGLWGDVRHHGTVQQLQPYDCEASESILIGSG